MKNLQYLFPVLILFLCSGVYAQVDNTKRLPPQSNPPIVDSFQNNIINSHQSDTMIRINPNADTMKR